MASPTERESGTHDDVASGRVLDYWLVERLLTRSLHLAVVGLVLFLWIPLAVMIALSFSEVTTTLLPFEGFTLEHYATAIRQESVRRSALGSVRIATVSATVATLLGVPLSFAITRYRFRLREIYRTFGILPMIIPGIILGVALRLYFQSLLGILPGFLTVVLTHSLYGLPFVMLIVTARLYTYDESLEEAARDLGADPITTFRDVTLPVIAPAVAAGFLFAWIRSFEDYIRVLFVSGPNTPVLTKWMFGQMDEGAATLVTPVSSLVVFVIAIALAIAMNLGNVTGYVAGTIEENEE